MNKCWCGSGLDYEVCHREFDKKINYYKKRGVMTPPRSMIKNQQQIEGIKKAAVVNNGLLDHIEKNIKIGMSTEDIDVLTREYLKEHNAHSADLNYEGYPKSICTSINDVVCHGIPSSDVILKDGDIINVDATSELPLRRPMPTWPSTLRWGTARRRRICLPRTPSSPHWKAGFPAVHPARWAARSARGCAA